MAVFHTLAADGHELTVIGAKNQAERSTVLPIVVRGAHLGFSNQQIDFGGVVIDELKTEVVEITNTVTDILVVEIDATAAQIVVSPSDVVLQPGETADVSVTFQPDASEELAAELRFRSTHDGLRRQMLETVGLIGAGWTPPHLELRDPATGTMLTEIDFAEVTVNTWPLAFRDVEFVNTGEAPLPEEFDIEGLFSGVAGNPLGDCSPAAATFFCIGDQQPNANYTLRVALRHLAGGASSPARVHLFPEIAGEFLGPVSISYGQEALDFSIQAEVVPYLLDDPARRSGGSRDGRWRRRRRLRHRRHGTGVVARSRRREGVLGNRRHRSGESSQR